MDTILAHFTMQPQQFRLRPDAFKAIRKKILLIAIPLLLIAMTLGFAIAHFGSDKPEGDFGFMLLAIPMALVFVVPSFLTTLKRQKTMFESYRLTFDGKTLIREQKNTPTIQLSFFEVRQISKVSNGSFVIQGLQKGDCIYVSEHIEDYKEVETALNNIMPVTTKLSKSLMQKYGWLLVLGMLGLMMVVFISKNAFLITGCGIVLLVFLGWGWYECKTNKSIDKKTRKGLWWLLILFFAVLARIIGSWMGVL